MISQAANTLLVAVSIPMFAGAAFMLGVGAWELFLCRWMGEIAEEKSGFVKAFQTVVLRRLGAINRQFMWPSYEAKVRHLVITAGEPSQLKPEEVMAMQEIAGVFALLLGLFLLHVIDVNLAGSLVVAFVGVCTPLLWLRDQTAKRHHLITRALPFNLDLLTLSVEAGLDFTAALSKVVEKGKGGPLRDELLIVLKQLKMGKTREEALKALIARVDLPALTSFVSALIQADRMGTSIGKVLRIQSTQMRIERTQRAEKLANEAPVKMLFPLIACIFPTVFMVLFGPIIFKLVFTGGE